MAWAKNGTPDTLSADATSMSIADMTAKNFNVILSHVGGRDVTPTSDGSFELNNNTNSVYAYRVSGNGGSDSTSASQTDWASYDDPAGHFTVMYICSVSGEEKLGIYFINNGNATGAASAPKRKEIVGKFVPSPDADITRVDELTNASDKYLADSNISALGTD